MGFTRITLLNAGETLGAHYNLADTKGTTIHNWYYPPSQGELQGSITWEPIPESTYTLVPISNITNGFTGALNLSPSDVVTFSPSASYSASTYPQFTFSMNLHCRAPMLTGKSVIVNIGEFSDTGFGLVVDSGNLALTVGYMTGQPASTDLITNAVLPANKTVAVIVTVDFNANSATAYIDGVSYSTTSVTQDYADVTGRVYLGRPSSGASWTDFTGFDGFISDFQMWRSLRSNVFFTGDLQKNAFVSTLNPYMYAPLTDNNGGVMEIMSGTLATPLTGLDFATFPDRVSQFDFDFPVFAPDGTLIPQASPSNPGTPFASGPNGGDNVQPPSEGGVAIEVIVPAIVVPVVVVAAGLIVLLVLLKRRKNKKGPKEEKKAVTIENPVTDIESARNAFAETRSTSYSNIPMQRVVASNNETSRNVDKLRKF
jgi:hypothetical protein